MNFLPCILLSSAVLVNAVFCSAQNCVLDAEIDIIQRNFGGPLEGPFFPGETITMCFKIHSWSSINNGCQFLQGLVPVFGNGWDPSSFNAEGMPVAATLNGNLFPAAATYTVGNWDWHGDVTYHHDNPDIQVGDFDGNGTIEICNSLFDPDCTGPGVTGGMAPPCWDEEAGTLLPPGWFMSGSGGDCTLNGLTRHDRGDGNNCETMLGPWEFCFELTARNFPDCHVDSTTRDLKVGFMTFADGDIGGRNFTSTTECAGDSMYVMTLPFCCNDFSFPDLHLIPDQYCSGDSINIDLRDYYSEFYTIIQAVLTDTTDFPIPVSYHISAFFGTGVCSVGVFVEILELGVDADTDGDGVCNGSDIDIDNDGIANAEDNCFFTFNPDQTDSDGDGLGNACDDQPGTRIGLNTSEPAKALHLHDGTLYIDNPMKGIIMKGMDGKCYRLTINIDGELSIDEVGCP